MFKPSDLFDLSQTEHVAIFDGCEYAWDALKKIQSYLQTHLRPGLHNHCEGVAFIGEQVFIGEGTLVEDGAMIKGPAIIGRNCEIRHNAYIRQQVIIGDNCVVGNSCEVKNSILFNHAVAPHFDYIGDSILGYKAHLGAGVKISNFKLVPGDNTDIGCNAVLNPGSIIGRGSIIYPNTSWRGVLPPNRIVKNKAAHEVVS